jgi:uncharacterized protein YbaR (Trm112 family)
MAAMSSPTHVRCCPRCKEPMAVLTLSTHRAAKHRGAVDVEYCGGCRLVWFDALESVQLDGLGWIRLLQAFQSGADTPMAHAKEATLRCPRCRQPLREVHNQTRFGKYRMLQCPDRDGHLQSAAGLFAERGLVRPLGAADRQALAEEREPVHCFNCGAPADGRGSECGYCGSPFVVLDLQRLAHALRVQVVDGRAAPRPGGTPMAWSCRACGKALDPSRDTACPMCGHLVVAPSIQAIEPVLESARKELEAVADAADARAAGAGAGRRRRSAGGARATSFGTLLHHLGVNVGTPTDDPRPAAWGIAIVVAVLVMLWVLGA